MYICTVYFVRFMFVRPIINTIITLAAVTRCYGLICTSVTDF